MECVIESRLEDTCAAVCEGVAEGVICVENGCEGATAFGYPGIELEALSVCGPSARAAELGFSTGLREGDAPGGFEVSFSDDIRLALGGTWLAAVYEETVFAIPLPPA